MNREIIQMSRIGFLALVGGLIGWFVTRNQVFALFAWLGGIIVWLAYCLYMGQTMEMNGQRNARPIWGTAGLLGACAIVGIWYFFFWPK